ncbi:cytochrome P450 [Sorangium sp. So ce1078]|uniref:cytochrome P450 n=1 Tax=Sorangium sp. So ce1078 TaxID=3133329 RepID=UPI003F62F298
MTGTPGFLQQLKNVDAEVQDPVAAARKKAGMVTLWISTSPNEFFRELRQDAPIFASPLFLIVTRYRDVREVYDNPDVFTIDPLKGKIAKDIGPFVLGMNSSPEYDRQKSLLRLAFPREDVARFRQIVEEETAALLEPLASGGELDLVGQYTRLLPAVTMRRYLGVSRIAPADIMRWTRPLFHDIFANLANDPGVEAAAAAAHAEATAALQRLLLKQRGRLIVHSSAPTVLARMLGMRGTPTTRMSEAEIRSCLLGLMVGAVDLTSIACVTAILQLLARPDALAAATDAAQQGNEAAVAGHVWEALRLRSPVAGLFRLCAADYTLARGTDRETRVKAGTLVFSSNGSAMQDEAELDGPEAYRVGRPPRHYLFFESGVHSCLGKYFSMTQIPLAVLAVLRLGKLSVLEPLQRDGGFPSRLRVKLA